MDKILLIDALNFIYRGNISFPSKETHEICHMCDKFLLEHQNERCDAHCICGEIWDLVDNRCSKNNEDHVLIFNFFRNFRAIIEQFQPDKCFICFEGRPEFRYSLYPDYKANRIIKTASAQGNKDKVYRCKDIIEKLLLNLPITICKAAKYEADDLVYSLVKNMRGEKMIVISNDSDYIQLLQEENLDIQVYNSSKKFFMEPPKENYVALKALKGDKSDNIPRLMSEAKSIKHLNDPKLLEKFLSIEENRANFSINLKLVKFADVPEEEIELQIGETNFDSLKKEFEIMKFESILNSWEKFTNTFNCLKL